MLQCWALRAALGSVGWAAVMRAAYRISCSTRARMARRSHAVSWVSGRCAVAAGAAGLDRGKVEHAVVASRGALPRSDASCCALMRALMHRARGGEIMGEIALGGARAVLGRRSR